MKLGALEDCDERLTRYTFTDTEYHDSDIRISMTAADDAPQEQLVRCNILYAIKTLAIKQLGYSVEFGARFTESHNGILLYGGVLDNKHDDASLQQLSNSSADLRDTGSQEKRASSAQILETINSTTTLLNITGSNDVEYEVEFYFTGRFLNKINVFEAILQLMMTLAQQDSYATVEHVIAATIRDPYWIFVMHVPDSSFSLQVFQVLPILEAAARYCVSRHYYRELSFRFLINRELIAHGCLTAPNLSRWWCQGMR